MKKNLSYSFCLILVLQLFGCGYSFQGSGSSLPPDVQRIAILRVENSTPEAGLSQLLTEALRDEFDRYGAVQVQDQTRGADAVLKTRIIKINRNTDTVTSNTELALETSTSMTVAAELRRSTGALLWRNPSLQVSKSFGADSGVVVTSSAEFSSGLIDSGDLNSLNQRELSRGQEREALQELAERLARNMYQDAVAPEF